MSPTVVVRVKFRPWRIVLVSHTNGRPTGTCLGRNRHGSGGSAAKDLSRCVTFSWEKSALRRGSVVLFE